MLLKTPSATSTLTPLPPPRDNGRMRTAMLALAGTLLLCCAMPMAARAATALQNEETETTTEEIAQRVIIEVSRFETAMGTVELEDDDVIAIRTPKGKIESYPKGRIIRILRLVQPEPGQTGVVMMRNGQVRHGVIIEDAFDHVLIEIEGIRARLVRDSVDHVVLQPTFEQTYRKFKSGLLPNFPHQHMELCRWLFQQRKYELCKKELEELLEKSELVEARRMMRLVDAQLALVKPDDENAQPIEIEAKPIDEADTSETGDLSKRRDILTHDDVNLIRVYEIDFDNPPRVTLEPSTIDKLIETYAEHKLIPASRTERNALYRAEPIDVVEHLIFELRARELYPEIKVITEPTSLNLFRMHVHNTWLMNNCASTDCHGGTFGGRLLLHRSGYRDARVRYTNLLILDRLKLDPELPPLIDYEHPANSLIIQYGLPRDEARYAHPDVPNWQPAFPPGNRKAANSAVEWIKAMMYPRPVYPIEFAPPTPKDEGNEKPDVASEPAWTPVTDDSRPERVPR
jgi:hypothetical protein